MRTNKTIILLCSFMVLVSLTLSPVNTYASDGTGGQVSTEGKISFYEEEASPDEPTPTEPEKPTEPETDAAAKPSGRLPDTGELIRNYGFIGIALLLLFLLVRKWSKEEK